ncbi:UDP-N-acetylglucosamine 2-epimerase [Citrobacter amalonaticus]|uniref:UDP-N-acetylglucosamine 2-epimerase n=1 Tax=Citrobacter amalonaticus TaxID=35703 RepID=UPI001908865A|nr:UDP-N-acetylglucosamine 2-epimerase [Citrobacter amalonaticus]MBJ9275170.1 UDP-N-acetylglucosamine 2-epimerase (hydrolyzing) [Citrobacter amalonaticus]HAU5068275.1 UDP-N-acetylglucosamine 2-epimerase (hydrolyzing) [Citrobacter amalonaticus]
MAKTIAVFTGTRAEYGLLYWLMKDIVADTDFNLQIIASGAHFSPEFGLTWRQIENDGFKIDATVEMLLSSDTPAGVVKSMGVALIGLADAYQRLNPDYIVILGDRYEALAAAEAAMLMRIPVIHLHGGEVTEGAYDDAIRHAITKLSYLHFTATEQYRQRVIQLGEAPERVFNVGTIGNEHLHRTQMMSLEEIETSLNFKIDKPFFVVTYHPVTLADEPAQESFGALLEALDQFPEYQIVITYPNADDGGRSIIPLLEEYALRQPERVKAVPSLGQKRYLSAVRLSTAVIGNSSSGISEVPSLKVPTVDIGQRQKGRLCANSVIHCEPEADSIVDAINKALLSREKLNYQNPYGEGMVGLKILEVIKAIDVKPTKIFYDV